MDDVDPCIIKREPGEPMFVLLARDSAAPETLEYWALAREQEIRDGRRADTAQEWEHTAEIRAKAQTFREWRAAHTR